VPPDRFRVATPLPPDGGWRCELALDRSTSPPRPVALARVPPAVSGDALALAALARGVDLASRLAHPSLQQVLGLVELGGGLAVVAPFREGESLRAVLDGGGALTPALASRVVGDVARAVQAVHALAAAGPRALAHGAVRPDCVLVCEDGSVLLTGLERPVEPSPVPSDDLTALPRLLAECLAPGGQGALPPELAPLCAAVLPGDVPRTAGEFADALAAAVQPAAPGALVARVDSAIPKGASARASRRRALAQALLAEAGGEAGPLLSPPAGTPALSPPPIRPPATTPVPGPAPPVAAAPPGDPAGRLALTPPPIRPPVRAVAPGETATAAVQPPAAPSSPAAWPPDQAPTATPIPAQPAAPALAPVTPAAPSPSIAPGLLDDPRLPVRVAVVLGLIGLVIGFLLGRG
jgi:eukaryotic-like serine/threonine-protein kinase